MCYSLKILCQSSFFISKFITKNKHVITLFALNITKLKIEVTGFWKSSKKTCGSCFFYTSSMFVKLLVSILQLCSPLKVKSDNHSKVSNLSNWKEEAWKNQGFNGIRTHDLRDTGAMLYQLSYMYEATHWEQGQFIEFISSHAVKWYEVYMK